MYVHLGKAGTETTLETLGHLGSTNFNANSISRDRCRCPFLYLLRYLKQQHCRVEAIGWSPATSHDLLDASMLAHVLPTRCKRLAKPSARLLKTFGRCRDEISQVFKSARTDVRPTFEMEQDVGAIVLEHLGNKLNVDVLNVDLLSPPYLH